MFFRFVIRAIVPLALFSSTVFAATAGPPTAQIEFMTGRVLLNSGHGFTRVDANAQVNVGDRLLISKSSGMTLLYRTAHCSVSYAEATLIVVPSRAPCKAGEILAAAGNNFALPTNFGTTVFPHLTKNSSSSVLIGVGVEAIALAVAIQADFFPISAP